LAPSARLSVKVTPSARQPEMVNDLRTNMILGCAITESTGIYSLVIALLLLFVF
jgi:F-type H+-transporting ATPase subunit c